MLDFAALQHSCLPPYYEAPHIAFCISFSPHKCCSMCLLAISYNFDRGKCCNSLPLVLVASTVEISSWLQPSLTNRTTTLYEGLTHPRLHSVKKNPNTIWCAPWTALFLTLPSLYFCSKRFVTGASCTSKKSYQDLLRGWVFLQCSTIV